MKRTFSSRRLFYALIFAQILCLGLGLFADDNVILLEKTRKTSNPTLREHLERLDTLALLPSQLQQAVLEKGRFSREFEAVLTSSDTGTVVRDVVYLFRIAKGDVSNIESAKIKSFCKKHATWFSSCAFHLSKTENGYRNTNVSSSIAAYAPAEQLTRVRNIGRAFVVKFICAIQEGDWQQANLAVQSIAGAIRCFDNDFSPTGHALRNDLVFRLCDAVYMALETGLQMPKDTAAVVFSVFQDIDEALRKKQDRISLERAYGLCQFERLQLRGIKAMGLDAGKFYSIDKDLLAYLDFMEKRFLFAEKPFYIHREKLFNLAQEVRNINFNAETGVRDIQYPLAFNLLHLFFERAEENARARASIVLCRKVLARVLGTRGKWDAACPFTGRKHEVGEKSNGAIVVRFADGENEVLLEISPAPLRTGTH